MKISLKNHVRTAMASRDITMWKDLSERLENNQGFKLSRTSLARQIEQDNPAYQLKLIAALCNELQCLPNDLFYIEITEASPEDIHKLTRRDKPFEYGYVSESESVSVPVAATKKQHAKPKPAASVSAPTENDDFDDELVGGRVSHLNIDKVTKRGS
jgi:DNA-binding Xre family transcriptional regulator